MSQRVLHRQEQVCEISPFDRPNYEELEKVLNQNNNLKRLACEPSESVSNNSSRISHRQYNNMHLQLSNHSDDADHSRTISEQQGQRAIQQFRRQIEARFQISVANKIYHFPKKYGSIDDIISSDQEEQQTTYLQKNKQQQQEEQRSELLSFLRPKLQKQQYKIDNQQGKNNSRNKYGHRDFKKKQPTHKNAHSTYSTAGMGIGSKLIHPKKKQSSNHSKNQHQRKKSKNSTKNSDKKYTNNSSGHYLAVDSSLKKSQRQTSYGNISKRLQTEPNSMNYMETIKLKMNRK